MWWTQQKTSCLLIENCVASESLQSQKTFAKDIPGLFNGQETIQLTSTDLACRNHIPEQLRGTLRTVRWSDAQLGTWCWEEHLPDLVVLYFLWTGLWTVFVSCSTTWDCCRCRKLAGTPSGFGILGWDCFCRLLKTSQGFWGKALITSQLQSYVSKHFAPNPSLYFFLDSVKQGKKHMCSKYCDKLSGEERGLLIIAWLLYQVFQKQTSRRSLKIMNSTC